MELSEEATYSTTRIAPLKHGSDAFVQAKVHQGEA
jgi:hypothetical protein